eukprot:12938700-Prorocentrum_lima.AAC.1
MATFHRLSSGADLSSLKGVHFADLARNPDENMVQGLVSSLPPAGHAMVIMVPRASRAVLLARSAVQQV